MVPLIMCPKCNHVTYAYPIYDNYGDLAGYRCSQCYNFFNYDQVNIIPFPNERIILRGTFAEFIAEIDHVNKDELYEKYSPKEIAEKFIYALLFMSRPYQPRLYRDTKGRIVWFHAPWDYRGTREAEERNNELVEDAQRIFAMALDNYYVAVEIAEMDEGDSVFIAVHPDDVEKIKETLKRTGWLL